MATLTIIDIQQINYGQLPSFGQVWVGNAGTDPLDTQVSVYTDYAMTSLVSTPLDLDFNGRPLDPDTGEVVTLYTNFSYSIQWTDKNGAPLLPDEVNVDISTGGGGSDGVVTSGALDTSSQLILQRSIGGPVPDIDLSGLNPVPSQVDRIIATGTYNVPVGARFLKVTCLGAGGGGSGSGTAGAHFGAGGGGGSTAITYISNPLSSYSVIVGTGGTGGTFGGGGAGGTMGGDTSFDTLCIAQGGTAGNNGIPGHGNIGVNTGDITNKGVSGQAGYAADIAGAAYKGGRGGGNGSFGTGGTSSPANSGAGGNGGNYPATGSEDGGNGGSGVIIVEVY